ncbi:M20 metallopeptidase family protein [Desulforamulus aquiferis]|uniref:Amidohydrolase n=1 Tax=Desulforamulus aquiferis TaxID=1397668 RepID=A0AAW7ZDR5_9FIRM|nr:amidohydrolase [Desulforamulus aquiferis]MDO7787853.1 amidohydrolase [Desulforamulus aquiferis]
MDIKKEVASLNKELINLRRDLHMHPELGYEEVRTSKLVADYLRDCGLEVTNVAKTGVVGLLRGAKQGKTLLLRADMDALEQTELNDIGYRSLHEGKMHACGHDGHTAMLMVTAKILAKYRAQIDGNIKFVFQPNEETAGALDMIKEGILESPRVDAAFGLHLWTPLESGKIGVVAGPTMAGNEEFELTIHGRGGHTASPQASIDPIMAAATIVQSIQLLQTREVSVLSPTLIIFGKIKGGTGRNIIADKVELGGTIRYLYENEDEKKEELKASFERIIGGICTATRTKYSLTYIPSNPSIINDPSMVELVRISAQKTLGCDQNVVPQLVMAGEDFAEFSRRVPSAFFFIGTGNKEKGTDYPHHHPQFNIDEDTLATGVEMHVRNTLAFLQGTNS